MQRFLAALVFATLADNAMAQTVIAPTEHLAFDRPESWALQYFTSGTLLMGFDPGASDPPGSVDIQFEGGWFPALGPEQERVGFAGTAAEDLNKAPIFLRPRVRVALSHAVALTVGGVPPVRAFGVKPRLASLGIEWAMTNTEKWRLAWRVHGETGTITGAFTCPVAVLSSAPGSAANPTGCETESSDVVTMRYAAIELEADRRLTAHFIPHVALALNAIDDAFQVNARAFGNIDHTRLETKGITWATAFGATVPLTRRLAFEGEALVAPLFVRRYPAGPRATDSFINIRGLISWRLR